jgi:hypothetical protein
MYKFFLIPFIAAMVMMIAPGCKKNNNPPGPVEEQLGISTDALALNEIPGPGADFNLTVLTAMPPAGVKIMAVVKGEIDNSVYYTSPSIETTSKTTKVDVLNLPKQKICICTITVTSKTKSTNTATTSFRVVYK